MKNVVLLLAFLTPLVNLFGQSGTDSLLRTLDRVLHNQKSYAKQKDDRINLLKQELASQTTIEEKYRLNNRIINEYQYYISDSVMAYIDDNKILASRADNKAWQVENKLQYAYILSSVGIFNEAQKILESVTVTELPDSLILNYYKCYEELYVHLLDFIDDSRFSKAYNKQLILYRDSVLQYLAPLSAEYLFWQFKSGYIKGQTAEARKWLQECLRKAEPESHLFAGANFCMSLFYDENKGEEEREDKLRYQIIAAISDVKSATKENFALIMLSSSLYNTGDIQRAYNYTHYALEDANFYNARYRNLQIGKMLPIIEEAYQKESERQKNRLRVALLFISVLSAGLLITIFYIRKQMISLSKARKSLDEMNLLLTGVNGNLNRVNNELSESNHIKEEYIGHFLNLCSTYIEKLEDYQRLLDKKTVLNKKSAESGGPVQPAHLIETELKEFYRNFDNVFLNIFPDFVERFNELMPEQERIVFKQNERLTTELRIFALIRLGITDSTKIANLLRYSLTTIYTYRSRIRNKSLYHDNFEEKIMQIGTFKA